MCWVYSGSDRSYMFLKGKKHHSKGEKLKHAATSYFHYVLYGDDSGMKPVIEMINGTVWKWLEGEAEVSVFFSFCWREGSYICRIALFYNLYYLEPRGQAKLSQCPSPSAATEQQWICSFSDTNICLLIYVYVSVIFNTVLFFMLIWAI